MVSKLKMKKTNSGLGFLLFEKQHFSNGNSYLYLVLGNWASFNINVYSRMKLTADFYRIWAYMEQLSTVAKIF